MSDEFLRPFYPYYRDIRSTKGPVGPSVEEQRTWVKQRMENHPLAEVIELGVEFENGYQGLKTPPSKQMKRPVLDRILKATQKNYFNRQEAIILLPDMPTCYRYKWIDDAIDFNGSVKMPIHPIVLNDDVRHPKSKLHPGTIKLLPNMKFKTLWQKIQTECSDFLAVVKKVNQNLLFRGIGDDDNGPAYLAFPEINRPFGVRRINGVKTITYAECDHSFVLDWMHENDVHARLDNSVSCTSDPEQARTYSGVLSSGKWRKIYAIFPRNGFKFSWARNSHDLSSLIHWDFYTPFNHMEWEEAGPEEDDLRGSIDMDGLELDLFLDGQTTDSVDYMIADQGEPDPNEPPPRLDWYDEQDLREQLWFADYVNGDLAGALRSEHEIRISDAPYYALDWTTYRTSILNELGFKLQNRRHYLSEKRVVDDRTIINVDGRGDRAAKRRAKMLERSAAEFARIKNESNTDSDHD